MKNREAAGAAAILCFGAVTAYLSSRMPIGSFRFPGPGMFPLCLGLLLAALAGARLAGVLLRRDAAEGAGDRPSEKTFSARPVICFLFAGAMAAVLLQIAGYAPTAFILVLFLLQTLSWNKWPRNIFISLLSSALSWLVFVKWLKIPFPAGWFGL